MAKHKIRAWARTSDGEEVEVLLPSRAQMVECIVEVDGAPVVVPLDELLLDHAEEIDDIAAILPKKADLGEDGKVLPSQLPVAAAGVTSFNGRTGAVVPQTGDYTAAFVGAEPSIVAGTAAQYYRGDKTMQDFAAATRGVALTGLSTATATAITATDTVLLATGKLQAQVTARATTNTVNSHINNKNIHATNLKFTDIAVPAEAWGAWEPPEAYADFGYRAAVSLPGVTAAMIPHVVFSPADSMSGNLAPVSDSYAGGVYLYAGKLPMAMTIPTITILGVS